MLLGASLVYNINFTRNFTAPEAMDAAQLARNIAEGNGFKTKFIRPVAIDMLRQTGNVTDEELKSAFDFFDVEGSGKITQAQLKKRLGVFYKDMPNKEYKFLMNDQSELTLDDLRELLLDNEVKNFDPVAEAFKVYDPDGTGFVDSNVLRSIFELSLIHI